MRDLEPFAALNADPEVMEHFPGTLSREQSDALAERIERDFRELGFGLWAAELPGEADLIGFVGLMPVRDDVPFAPAIEVGWRLARPYWGRGLAFEAARACLDHAFGELALDEVVSYTAESNARSRRLMERLGMSRDPAEDFAHPAIEPGHRLSRHVVYRLRRLQSSRSP